MTSRSCSPRSQAWSRMPSARSSGTGTLPSGGPLVAELSQRPVVLPPVASHTNPEVQEDPDPEERLELPPRRLPDPLERRAPLTDDDRLLGRALDKDLAADVHRRVLPPLGDLLHPHRAGVRHLLAHRQEELLADRLGDEE